MDPWCIADCTVNLWNNVGLFVTCSSVTRLVLCLRLSIRYKAIVNPMDIQTSSAVFWTCLKAVSIWLLSVLLAVPEAVFSQVVSMQVKPFCPSLAWLILIRYLRCRWPSFFSPLRVTALTPPSRTACRILCPTRCTQRSTQSWSSWFTSWFLWSSSRCIITTSLERSWRAPTTCQAKSVSTPGDRWAGVAPWTDCCSHPLGEELGSTSWSPEISIRTFRADIRMTVPTPPLWSVTYKFFWIKSYQINLYL